MSLGMLGLGVALLASASLTQVLAALGGPAGRQERIKPEARSQRSEVSRPSDF